MSAGSNLVGAESTTCTPLPPLHKHQENQADHGQTGSRCLDKAVLAGNTRYQKNVCHRKPAHASPKHRAQGNQCPVTQLLHQGTRKQCAGKFQQVLEVLTASRSPFQPCASLRPLGQALGQARLSHG